MSDDTIRDAERSAREARASFLRKMAHEMRTPLSSMLMLAELLADNAAGRLGDKEVGWARKMQQAGSEIRELLDGVLELSRIETGAVEVEPAPVELATIAERLVGDFPELATEIGPRLPATVTTDRRLLARLLGLLATDAARATSGGASREAVTLRFDRAGRSLTIEAGWGGPRVPEEQRSTFFEPFQPGRRGVGLAIARALAELLGGRLTLRAREPGDAFVVELPL